MGAYDSAPLVDVHHHIYPPHMVQKYELLPLGTLEESQTAIDKLGIKAAILSPTILTPMLEKWDSRKLVDFCRDQTEWQASQVRESPATRGSFAPLPLSDIDETLKAVKHCETELSPKVDGYAVTTSVNDKYLGDLSFTRLWQALNTVHAVLFVHPNETIAPKKLDPERFNFTIIEYPQETTRTIMSMIDEGTFVKYPNIRWIFAHNGGSFPYLFQRIVRAFTPTNRIGWGGIKNMHTQFDRIAQTNDGMTLQEVMASGNIYLEGALGTTAHHTVMKNLGISASNLLCGSDVPFTILGDKMDATYDELRAAERCGIYTPKEIKAIYSGNALALFPRLKVAWEEAGI